MKIRFLVFDVYGMGGTVRTVLNVTNYLAQSGYDIEVVSVFRHRNIPFFEIDPRIKVTVLHDVVNRKNNQFDMKSKVASKLLKVKSRLIHPDDEGHHFFSALTDIKMYNYIKSIDSGILVSTRPSFNIFASKYANKNVKVIGQEHLNFAIYPERLKRSIVKHYSSLDYLATLTDEDTTDYKELLSSGSVKVKKLTNSIPKLQGGISSLESKTIIAAGRLVPQKGFDLLIEAFKIVNEKHPDWKLKIFGGGRERQNLLDLIEEKELYNHVVLMGSTPNIDVELTKSSIYALSSRFEGFGMVIVEAMQCGVPVVSFDCPKGPGEIIKHNEDGILVEDGNIEAFADSLIRLIEDEELRKEFSDKGMKNVKRYEIDEIGKKWKETISELITQPN
ncbi:glycosyltransferase family 4 protein [Anaerobacillus sp. 1_MG-2023]|uniref:glycosyltransferase family 4 protein n=1 Tax=Anaerobacillus sp. 1_MG-2023 TaxID=3062655 RepID=UPI0026E1E8BD|nr:glycosyltransferase family 4 protein [Anaerobacillus sp. 1_MG-2023]MDO6658240.1 glycosyltransferase family 4 protein [Anaerobacillus sp. 1_MG-2023]